MLFFLMIMDGLVILSGKPLILGLDYSSTVVPGWVWNVFLMLMNIGVLLVVVISIEVGPLLIW